MFVPEAEKEMIDNKRANMRVAERDGGRFRELVHQRERRTGRMKAIV